MHDVHVVFVTGEDTGEDGRSVDGRVVESHTRVGSGGIGGVAVGIHEDSVVRIVLGPDRRVGKEIGDIRSGGHGGGLVCE
jgi:hypothetical protein